MIFLDEIINQFHVPGSDREIISKPYSVDDYVIATEGQMLLMAPKSRFKNSYDVAPMTTASKLKSVIPEQKLQAKISVKELYEKIDAIEKDKVYNHADCEPCDGWGQVDWEFYHNGKTYREQFDCPICDGSGEGEIESTEIIYGFHKKCKIGANGFTIQLLEKILKLAIHLELDEMILLTNEQRKPALFLLGDVKIMLMPVYIDEDFNPLFEIEVVA